MMTTGACWKPAACSCSRVEGFCVRSTVSNGTPSLVSWRLVASHCGQCGLVNTVTVMATPLDVVLMNSEAKAILQRCDLKSRHYM